MTITGYLIINHCGRFSKKKKKKKKFTTPSAWSYRKGDGIYALQ